MVSHDDGHCSRRARRRSGVEAVALLVLLAAAARAWRVPRRLIRARGLHNGSRLFTFGRFFEIAQSRLLLRLLLFHGLLAHDLDVEHVLDELALDLVLHRLEHPEAFVLVLDERVALTDRAQPD